MNKRQLFWFPIFQVHVLLREMLRRLTFEVVMWLLKWLLLWVVDFLLLLVARVMLGDTNTYGLTSPAMGPLELKNKCGKMPVLDVGTLAKIRKGQIKVHRMSILSQVSDFYGCGIRSCGMVYEFVVSHLVEPNSEMGRRTSLIM